MDKSEWDRLNSVNVGVSLEESQDFYHKWASKYNEVNKLSL